MLIVLASGCAALREPEVVRPATPGNPVWERQDVRQHLEFLNSSSAAMRVPGSSSIVTASDYLATRMRGYLLQPVYHSGFQMAYDVPEHRIHAARVAGLSTDSTALALGYDFFPDGRSDSGSVVLSFVHLAPGGEASMFPSAGRSAEGVMLRGDAATTKRLDTLSSEGFRLALVVQDLEPVSATRAVDGMLVIQVTRQTAAWMLGFTPTIFDSIWDQPGVVLRSLPRRLRVEVDASTYPSLPTLNVAGFMTGRHPALSQELIIVAADIATWPMISGERVFDLADLGVGLSAMLEVARNEQSIARRLPHPARTVMFVALNSRDGQGLERLLATSPWLHDQIRRVIYIGLLDEDEAAVRRVLEPYEIPLDIVRASGTLTSGQRFAFPVARVAHARSPIADAADRPAALDSSVLLSQAEEVVIDLATAVHERLLRYSGTVTVPESELVVRTPR